ncbi:uncharacterized protein Z518_09743 [Rhinocladiella mackenziei CBS 650.93]|uniref:tRNA/rRNA methyltransferase SpoU type domain-containing protein n=1 Tax=Rhinocladiella mackenziei CBS 650.93 TaxID=1442369 RepID=A0A0D2GQU3_9EURO|nr:uncharacterized protein Z518_09743 [Rhinocladiella mackenziei CBS 650.93]KIX00678.1 hypothetical protein Z518_09743 [Rhinocladiella mackenziei CBS 650.93]
MLSSTLHVLRSGLAVPNPRWFYSTRTISLTGAIEKGIREGQYSASKHESRYTDHRNRKHTVGGLTRTDFGNKARYLPEQRRRGTAQTKEDATPEQFEGQMPAPASIPYTTASSEFIYGTFSVLAALKANRRKAYKLYRLQSQTETSMGREDKETGEKCLRYNNDVQKEIYRIAKDTGVEVKNIWGSEWDKSLAKVTGGRPHNGLVLEASPLPRLPVTSLSAVKYSSDDVVATLGWASREEQELNSVFEISEGTALIPSSRPCYRYPFMLLLDCITDTGNFGAIVRSAWFLGVDAVLVPEHGTASVSANTLKASSGALEYLPILSVKNEREFVKKSRKQGWKFFASVAPDMDQSQKVLGRNSSPLVDVEGALLKYPCVLVLGNEATGIRPFMRNLVDGMAGIPNARPEVREIDSLNVSVAAALMTQRFFASAPAGATQT